VGDTNFSDHYAGVNHSMAWNELHPAIRQATEKYVLDYVGTEFYDMLADLYDTGPVTNPTLARALEYLQQTIAYYSIYHILPQKNGAVTSLGVVQNTPEGGSAPINQWSWKAMRWDALDNGDVFLDRLLSYMEKQVAANNAEFNTWKNSSAYKVKTSDFFRHTPEVDDFLNIQNSRRSYISLVRFFRQIEEDMIKPILCDMLYLSLKTSPATTANAKLLPYVKKAVAYLGAAEAVAHHRVVIDGDGFRIVSQTDGFDDRRNMTNNTHADAISALKDQCAQRGAKFLADLRGFLENNLVDYPDYANSNCREKGTDRRHGIVQDWRGKGAVGIL
jgi:hypothetical protein